MLNASSLNETIPFEEMITSGGDERLDQINGIGNKYHVQPTRFLRVLNRGSCTCSPFSPDGYEAARKLYEVLDTGDFQELRQQQVVRIKRLLNYNNEDRFHVFFAPSGSDLCYYQLLFARLISPSRNIFNIVTCPEELGSGSIRALEGKLHADRNQFGETTARGARLVEDVAVTCEYLPARSSNGNIINHRQAIYDLVQRYYPTHAVNGNLVIGSKSGIENNVSIVSEVPEGVQWTIDLCQFRASKVLVNGLLGMNCSVMLTGSKFYQSPPFCAALLVPKTITERFKEFEPQTIAPFGQVFSCHDIPEQMAGIRSHLPAYENHGLLLRWQAALEEMEMLDQLSTHKVISMIDTWNQLVISRLQASRYFELMPGQEVTNKTIISFRIKSKEGDYLSHEVLKQVYEGMCRPGSQTPDGYDQVLFGQPVQYGEKSFLRLALGASDLRRFIEQGFEPTADEQLITMIEQYVEEHCWNS